MDILSSPSRTGAVPHLAPKRTCAARPPAPWQLGNAPNQHPIKFISPTDAAIDPGRMYLSGNHWLARWVTEITELSVVRGSCGRPARKIPVFHSAEVGTTMEGVEGPRDSVETIDGSNANTRMTPMITMTRAAGMLRGLWLGRAAHADDGEVVVDVVDVVDDVLLDSWLARCSVCDASPTA